MLILPTFKLEAAVTAIMADAITTPSPAATTTAAAATLTTAATLTAAIDLNAMPLFSRKEAF